MRARIPFIKLWWKHVVIGVPLSSFIHTCLQFAYGYVPDGHNHLLVLPIHFAFGVLVGGVLILGPAYTLQALCAALLSRCIRYIWGYVIAGAAVQSSVVIIWSQVVGIEPSLSGNFLLTRPMIALGAIAGGIVGYLAAPVSLANTASS